MVAVAIAKMKFPCDGIVVAQLRSSGKVAVKAGDMVSTCLWSVQVPRWPPLDVRYVGGAHPRV